MRGDVIVVPFPFSDLAAAKRRPALVLAELDGDDCIHSHIFLYRVGRLSSAKVQEIIDKVVGILRE